MLCAKEFLVACLVALGRATVDGNRVEPEGEALVALIDWLFSGEADIVGAMLAAEVTGRDSPRRPGRKVALTRWYGKPESPQDRVRMRARLFPTRLAHYTRDAELRMLDAPDEDVRAWEETFRWLLARRPEHPYR